MIDRRTLVLTAPAVALGGKATVDTIDPHAAWVAEHNAVTTAFSASEDEASEEHYHKRRCELEELICFTPANTPQGAVAQLEFAISEEANFEMVGGVWKDLDGALMCNVIKTLKSLA